MTPSSEITAAGPALSLENKTLPEAEKDMVLRALQKSNGNRSAAARALGVPRHVLLYRLKKYGIT